MKPSIKYRLVTKAVVMPAALQSVTNLYPRSMFISVLCGSFICSPLSACLIVLVDINETGTSWNNKDRISVAALTAKEHSDLFSNIAMLMSQGFNPSAASMILAKVKLSTKAIKQALKGEYIKLPQRAEINIERGHKFVTLCNAAGITNAFVTKRYFIEGFNSYAASNGEEKAFEALQELRNLNLAEKELKAISAGDDFSALLKQATEAEPPLE